MDTVRYLLGWLLWVTMPPAVAFWFIVHPFVRHWRRLGATRTYVIVLPIITSLGVGLFLQRARLLGRDLGTAWGLVTAGAGLYVLSIVLDRRCRRQFKFRILVGMPELRDEGSAGALLTGGPYQLLRHPRYVALVLGIAGWALIANYTGVYVLLGLLIAALLVLIHLEERELLSRFGEPYRRYRRAVPMLIPRPRRVGGTSG